MSTHNTKQTKTSTGFSATVLSAPVPVVVPQNIEVNELLLQAIVAACKDNPDFESEVLNALNNSN